MAVRNPIRIKSKDIVTSPAGNETALAYSPNLSKDIQISLANIAGYVQSLPVTKTRHAVIPIEWAEDGSVAPDAAELITDTNGNVRVRKFSGTVDQDVVIPWMVPDNLDADEDVKFSVVGVITEATTPSPTERAYFGLAGYSIGHEDPIDGTFGDQVSVIAEIQSESQYDLFETYQSDAVTITNLAAGELAMLQLQRRATEGQDTYAQKIGVSFLKIEYSITE